MNSQAKNVASTATVSNSIAPGYINTSLVNSSTSSGIDIEEHALTAIIALRQVILVLILAKTALRQGIIALQVVVIATH